MWGTLGQTFSFFFGVWFDDFFFLPRLDTISAAGLLSELVGVGRDPLPDC